MVSYQIIAASNGFRVEVVGESTALYAWTKDGKYSTPFLTEAEAWKACVETHELSLMPNEEPTLQEAIRELVRNSIRDGFITADGNRVMLSIDMLTMLGCVDEVEREPVPMLKTFRITWSANDTVIDTDDIQGVRMTDVLALVADQNYARRGRRRDATTVVVVAVDPAESRE